MALALIRLAATLLVAIPLGCSGADKQFRPALEVYLKRIGYEAIAVKRDEHNKLLARGELNGKERTFLVDTGCSVSTLDRGVARKLKTLGEADVVLKDSLLGKVTNQSVALMDLKLGRATFTNQPAAVRTLDISGHSVGDGLLGCDFLFRNYCLIDCLDCRLYARGTALSPEARSEFDRLLVDTGSPWSALDRSQIKPLGLRPYETRVKIAGIGKIGAHWLDVAKLKSLQLGDLVLGNVDFGVAKLEDWKIGESGTPWSDVQGILGAELLVLNAALIDCRQLKLWLQPLKSSQ